MFGLFGKNKDNPANTLWHRDGSAIRYTAAITELMDRFGLPRLFEMSADGALLD